jgi:hypothetical protein
LIEDGKQSGKPLKGIVVGGTGNGTVHENLLPVLQEAQKNGIKVWVSSRATDGVVDRQPGEFPFVKLPPDQALSEMRVMRMADNWLIEQQRISQENQLD